MLLLRLKFSLLLILGLLSLPAFVQAETELNSLSSSGGKVIIQGGPPGDESRPEAPPVEVNSPQVPQNEVDTSISTQDESDLAELQAVQDSRIKKVTKIEKTLDPLKDPVLNPIEEIQKLGHKQLDAASLLDERVIEILQRVFKDGLLGNLSVPEVRALVLARSKGTIMETVFDSFPFLLNLSIDLLRDKDAFHGLLTLMLRKDDLKTYGYIWICFFLFGLFIKQRLVKPKWTFFRRFRWNMTINLILTLIVLIIFYQFFSVELDPTLKIIQNQL